MTNEHRLDEGLETIFVLKERGMSDRDSFLEACRETDPKELLAELTRAGLVSEGDGEIHFTSQGFSRAEGILRRHRLAEVLMQTVLQIEEHEIEETACAFEHLLSERAVDRVCSFLGHPTHCPHGRPIPPGKCCGSQENGEARVYPLSEMSVGDLCEIVHIRPRDHGRLDRLGAYGLVPSSIIRLHQKKPSFVIQIDETDLAIDLDVARDIYVRLRG